MLEETCFWLKTDTTIGLRGFPLSDCQIYNVIEIFNEEIEDVLGFNCDIEQRVNIDLVSNTILLELDHAIEHPQGYTLNITHQKITVKGQTTEGIYYGICQLIQSLKKNGPRFENIDLAEEPDFGYRGVLLDVTRGKVPSKDYLRRIIRQLSLEKVNQIQLYIEHTFLYSFTTEMNLGKDGFSKKDLMDLDAYCNRYFIELIPCIATFGHLYELLSTESYNYLAIEKEKRSYSWMDRQLHHTLDCRMEDSFLIAKNMIEEISGCFSSKHINISGDETYDLESIEDSNNLYIEFLNRLIQVVKDLGKTPMYWGDIILKSPERISEIYPEAIPMHWWYEREIKEQDFIEIDKQKKPFYACPGTSSWNRFVPDVEKSLDNIKGMLQLGKKHNAIGALVTDWGDFGHVNYLALSMPMLAYGAKMAWNINVELDTIKDEYKIFNSLLEISSFNQVTFENVMKWYYEHTLGLTRYGSHSEQLERLSEDALIKDLQKIEVVEQGLLSLLKTLKKEEQKDALELINALGGIKWQNELFVHFLSKEKVNPRKLAISIELWYSRFEVIWRKRNRESEIYRIREVVQGICKYLRGEE